MKKLDWIETENLAGVFLRTWDDALRSPKDAPTNKEIRRAMGVAEKRILRTLKSIRRKQFRLYSE